MAVSGEPLRIGVLGAARISALSIVGPAAATGHRLVAVAAAAAHSVTSCTRFRDGHSRV